MERSACGADSSGHIDGDDGGRSTTFDTKGMAEIVTEENTAYGTVRNEHY